MDDRDFRAAAESAAGMGADSDRDAGAHAPVTRPPSPGRTTMLFECAGGPHPEGQYMVDIWEDGRVTLAWREKTWHTWSAPVEGRVQGWLDELREFARLTRLQRSVEDSVATLRGVHGPKGDRSQVVTAWTEPSTTTTNEPTPSVPYDIENESSPPDELAEWQRYLHQRAAASEIYTCLVCGERQPRWYGEAPASCRNCGAEPKDRGL